jgi:hypothetical protein
MTVFKTERRKPSRPSRAVPEHVISKQYDANPDTIERWYDMSAESDRREARREHVEDHADRNRSSC